MFNFKLLEEVKSKFTEGFLNRMVRQSIQRAFGVKGQKRQEKLLDKQGNSAKSWGGGLFYF